MKLMSLGRLTASIAHEIRNPLGAISHASQLLEESTTIPDADRRLLDIINNHKKPFQITSVIHDLPDLIHWRLKENIPGFSYTLEVEDISKKAGEYTGHLILQTDHPQKRELMIIIYGYIEEN